MIGKGGYWVSFDGVVTRAVVHECRSLVSGRIVRIQQLSDWEVVLRIRVRGENHSVLFCIHPVYARFHSVGRSISNLPEPPTFCMVLRKQLEGAILLDVCQVGLERIVHWKIGSRDELGNVLHRLLVMEIMGRHSNLILVDPVNGTIIDGLHRVSATVSRYRQVYPGAVYRDPPAQDKVDPLTVGERDFLAGFDYNRGQLHKQLVERFFGIGPLLAQALVHQGGVGPREQLWGVFSRCVEEIRNHRYIPTQVVGERRTFFHVFPLPQVKGRHRTFSTMSECLQISHYGAADRERLRGQVSFLLQVLERIENRNRRKMEQFAALLEESEEMEQQRLYGELLMANLHRAPPRGSKEMSVENYHDPERREITIPLEPSLSPNENAQRYFRRYKKMQRGVAWHQQQWEAARKENQYIESVVVQLEQGGIEQFTSVQEELVEAGLLRAPRKNRKRSKQKKTVPVPLAVESSDGTLIHVGRNNKQNDYLTHRLAHGKETWLHAQNIPGSHVVIRSQAVSETTLQEAAMLAAYFSKARSGSRVPVDYVLVRYVRKPAGSPPGFALYEGQRTLFVTPDEEKIRQWLS